MKTLAAPARGLTRGFRTMIVGGEPRAASAKSPAAAPASSSALGGLEDRRDAHAAGRAYRDHAAAVAALTQQLR